MNNIRFFDNIENKNNKFLTFCENFFYIDGLSGRLGFKKFSVFSEKSGLIQEKNLQNTKISWKVIALNIGKAIALLSIVIPTITICGKIYQHTRRYKVQNSHPAPDILKTENLPFSNNKNKVQNSPPAPDILKTENLPFSNNKNDDSSKKYLEQSWTNYKASIDIFPSTPIDFRFMDLTTDLNKGESRTNINPDLSISGNLTLEFENESTVCYLPAIYKMTYDPKEKEIDAFKEGISAAFATNKSLIVTRLSCNNIHTIAAVFKENGEFQLIDSMNGEAVNITKLTEELNKAQIKDRKGKMITFRGEYIKTGLQKGGHECVRFATLYAYQIAKDRDPFAYSKVNGAFKAGLLKSFEDYKKISKAPNVIDMQLETKDIYQQFISSWTYRIQCFEVDNWKQVKLKELNQSFSNQNDEMGFWIIRKDNIPHYRVVNPEVQHIIGEKEGQKQPIDFKHPLLESIPFKEDLTSTTLESILPQDDERHILIMSKENPHPKLYRLSKGQEIFRTNDPGEDPYEQPWSFDENSINVDSES